MVRVFGRRKVVSVRTLRTLCELTFTFVNIAQDTESKSRQRCGSDTPCWSWGAYSAQSRFGSGVGLLSGLAGLACGSVSSRNCEDGVVGRAR
jgi:hypothetical protein